ncbi:MAG TPA: hypothetical protein VF747_13635 [Blastocatellia bacterium]|jgi:hypothetical protein
MFLRKKERTSDEGLDRIGKSVVRSGGMTDEETEAIASTPFLYAQLRARIEAEQRRRAGSQAGLFAALFVARRAIPALVLVAVVAFGAFWLTKTGSAAGMPDGVIRNENLARYGVGGACALSSTEECAISTEEVLATLFAEGEAQR